VHPHPTTNKVIFTFKDKNVPTLFFFPAVINTDISIFKIKAIYEEK
jgi:hypothetical protein